MRELFVVLGQCAPIFLIVGAAYCASPEEDPPTAAPEDPPTAAPEPYVPTRAEQIERVCWDPTRHQHGPDGGCFGPGCAKSAARTFCEQNDPKWGKSVVKVPW